MDMPGYRKAFKDIKALAGCGGRKQTECRTAGITSSDKPAFELALEAETAEWLTGNDGGLARGIDGRSPEYVAGRVSTIINMPGDIPGIFPSGAALTGLRNQKLRTRLFRFRERDVQLQNRNIPVFLLQLHGDHLRVNLHICRSLRMSLRSCGR